MKRYLLGIDGGTESTRSAVFDEFGHCIGFGTSDNVTVHPHPGWAEQSIHEWESSLVDSIKKAISNSGIDPNDIAGIGAGATCPTVVALDQQGRPLRDAIMWMDLRATREAREIAATEDPALKYVGFGNVSPEWFPCKILWLKRNEPDIYDKAVTILDQPDWLAFTLTGEKTLNINTTTVRWFYDSTSGGFPLDFYQKIGIGDFLGKTPSRMVRLGETIGGLSGEMAQKTGLRAGTPVAGGGADAYIGVVGVNALEEGRLALITGSSQLQIGLVGREFHAPGINGTFPNAIIPGHQVVEAGQISTGSVLKWFKDDFVNGNITEAASRRGVSVYRELDEMAARIPLGSEGLLVLEHWQGNRTPWVDPASRGVIRGLTLSHTPAHVFRAMLEGVAYGTAVILDRMEAQGVEINEMVACGGATNSKLWMQIHADVTGRPITIPEEAQAVSLGSAVLASVAGGIYDSIHEAAKRMVRIEEVIEPDLHKTDKYRFYAKQYMNTYECLKDESHALVKRVEESRDEERDLSEAS